jgi:hypothetical protein
MPRFEIEINGKRFEAEGPSMEAVMEAVLAQQNQAQPAPGESFAQTGLAGQLPVTPRDAPIGQGVADTLGNVASFAGGVGDIALTGAGNLGVEAIAGLGGVAELATGGNSQSATSVIEQIRQRLGFQLSPEGENAFRSIAGNIPEPVQEFGQFLGEKHQDLANLAADTAGPLAATIVDIAPDIGGTILGLRGLSAASKAGRAKRIVDAAKAKDLRLRSGSSRQIRKALDKSAPSIDELGAASNELFAEAAASKALFKPGAAAATKDRLFEMAKNFSRETDSSPEIRRMLNTARENLGGSNVTMNKVVRLRNQISDDANTANGTFSRLAQNMLEEVETLLENQGALIQGSVGKSVGETLRQARQLAGRKKRALELERIFTKVEDSATAYPRALANEFRSLINNPKRSKYFDAGEIQIMRDFVRNPGQKVGRVIGAFGIGEGGNNPLVILAGVVIGPILGLGPQGMAVMPAIGTVSKQLAARLAQNKGRFLSDVVRAGPNGRKIIRSYYKHTPKGARDPAELTQLLINNKIPLDDMPIRNPLVAQAVSLAKEIRAALPGAVQASAGAAILAPNTSIPASP